MVYRHVAKELRGEVFEAVQRVIASGSKESKVSIVSRFLDRGVSRASLYAWVSRDMEDIAAGLVVHIPPLENAPPPALRVGTVQSDPAAPPLTQPTGGIAYEQRLNNALRRGDVMRAMAYWPDGKVRNIRLIRDTDEQERKVLQTAALIQEKTAARQREMHSRYMDEIIEIVLAEIPSKRDLILQRLEDVGLKYGVQA